jgi:hypothetical protein
VHQRLTATAMSALMVDGCAESDGSVVCGIAAEIGVRRRYDAADGNSNGFVGEVLWMIAVMMAKAMSELMVTAMPMCCLRQW